ncbi:hypothetical protein HAZT_HAZT003899 [Hyalella azteca]|uniref:Uncharacterized protein n=1 Tax=Hyalella azteca TaxID=294128 RepID=A0A6A0HE13_HYAAZ|nr:hypothetical protein HAZT_HAZT003899 [Hyalella azteca]
MDNFTGLFGDADLGDLDLGVDSFGGPPGPTPVSVSDLDLANYSQPSYTNIGSNPEQQQAPSQQPQKAGHLSCQSQPQPQQLQPQGGGIPGGQPSFGVPPQGYQYGSSGGGAPQQAPMGQFSMGGQYRPPYHSQDMYGQSAMPSWGGNSDPFSGPPSQPGYPMPGSQPGGRQMGGYQGGPMQGMPNSLPPGPPQQQSAQPGSIGQNYPGHGMPQGYQGQPSPYATGPRPSYPSYDPQRGLAPGGSMMFPGGPHGGSLGGPVGPHPGGPLGPSGSHGPGNPPQQYVVRPATQQPQQYANFPQPSASQMMASHGSPADMSRQYSTQHPQAPSHQIPNGSPAYRPSYTPSATQMSPHSQMSPHPQMSPRSMSSPHPTSSPVPNQSTSGAAGQANSATTSSGGVGSSLQHLENMVKPSMGAPPSSAPTSQSGLQSSMYSGPSGIPSPISNRGAPMSPGVSRPVGPSMSPVMSPRPPMSPQQWGTQARPPQNYNMQPGYHSSMTARGPAPNIAQLQENMHPESIGSATSGKLSIPANVPQSTSAMPAVDSGLSGVTNVAAATAPSSIPNPLGVVQQQQPGVHVPPNTMPGNTAPGAMPIGGAAAPNGMMSHRPPGSLAPCGPYPQQFRMNGPHQYRPGSPLNSMPHHQGMAPRQPSMLPNMSQSMMPQPHHPSNSSAQAMSVAPNVSAHQINSMAPSQISTAHLPRSPQPVSSASQHFSMGGMTDLPSPHSSHTNHAMSRPATVSSPAMSQQLSASAGSSSGLMSQANLQGSGMMCSSPLQLQPCGSPQMMQQDSYLQSGSPSTNTGSSPLPNNSGADATRLSPMGTGMSSGCPTQVPSSGNTEQHPDSSPHHLRPNSQGPMIQNLDGMSGGPLSMGGSNQRSFSQHGNMGFGNTSSMGPAHMRPNSSLGMHGSSGAPRAPSPCGPNGSPGMSMGGASPMMPSSGPGLAGPPLHDPIMMQQRSAGPTPTPGRPEIPSPLRAPGSQMPIGTPDDADMVGSGSSPSTQPCGGSGGGQLGTASPMLHGSPQMNQGSPVPLRPQDLNQPMGGVTPLGTNGPGPMNMGGSNGQMLPGPPAISLHAPIIGPGGMMSSIPSAGPLGPGMRPVGPNMMGPRGPSGPVMMPLMPGQPPPNLQFELQQCQQQLQQLYKMPQNLQTQQQINDIQQRINQLQQQQQQFMQSQAMFVVSTKDLRLERQPSMAAVHPRTLMYTR